MSGWQRLKKLGIAVGLLGLYFAPAPLWAAPSIQAKLDKDEVALDDTLILTVTIRGGTMLSSPDIPAQGNFDVVGRSSGNSIEIINGIMSSTMTFQYILSPRAEGEFNLGPIKVYIEGEEYSAPALHVSVTAAQGPRSYIPSTPSMPGAPPGYPPAFSARPSVQDPSAEGSGEKYKDTFITAETDLHEAYVGQQVLYTFRLYSAVSVQGAQLNLPEFKDFITEELTKEKKYQVQLNGRTYAVNEWRFALFPTKAGMLKTGEGKVQGNVPVPMANSPFNDPFFTGFATSLRPKTFIAPNVDVKVKELPPAPANFTGLVGQFQMNSTLSKEVLNLGETSDYRVEISGRGNIAEANLPKIENISNFKIYPSKPEVQVQKGVQGLQGKKIFAYAFVADRPGSTTIPALSFSYFDPEKASYEKLETLAMAVQIRGSANDEKLVTAGLTSTPTSAGENKGKSFDLGPLKTPGELLYSAVPAYGESMLAGLLLFGSPLAFLGLLFVQGRRARALAQADDRKRSRAFKKAKSTLAKLNLDARSEDIAQLSNVLREYLGDRFLVKGGALIPSEIEGLLAERAVPSQTVRSMVYLLEQLDSWKYGGMKSSLPADKAFKQEILDLLREVEKSQ